MYDITVVGCGIVGLATAYEIFRKNPKLSILLIDKESVVAKHQSGNNSGVIHSGIYYEPNSLKARICREGRKLLIDFCNKNNIKYETCGKIIVAKNDEEVDRLNYLYQRGKKNNISKIKKITKEDIKNYEPHVIGAGAIFVPSTGIVDYSEVANVLFKKLEDTCVIQLNTKLNGINRSGKSLILITNNNPIKTKLLINCGGLYSDLITEISGIQRKSRIIPFRGEYFLLKGHSKKLVKNLIYPLPDLKYPFLGVHFTRRISGSIEAGPNAVLAWAREGYKKSDINIKDIIDYITFQGFWNMSKKHWRMGLNEYMRSFSKKLFLKSLQEYVPEVKITDLVLAPSGVRAQALDKNGNLIDDFLIERSKNIINVINAPSPAATSCFAIGQYISRLND